jgi:hypothetical protein
MLVLEQRIAMDCSDLWPDLADVAVPERAMELGVRVR